MGLSWTVKGAILFKDDVKVQPWISSPKNSKLPAVLDWTYNFSSRIMDADDSSRLAGAAAQQVPI